MFLSGHEKFVRLVLIVVVVKDHVKFVTGETFRQIAVHSVVFFSTPGGRIFYPRRVLRVRFYPQNPPG